MQTINNLQNSLLSDDSLLIVKAETIQSKCKIFDSRDQTINQKKKKRYLFFAQKVADLNGLASTGDRGVDGKVGVDEAHLVAVALGDAGDEILDVAEGGSDGGAGLARAKPGVDLQLALSGLVVGDEIEVEVQMLEVPGELASGAFNFDDLGVHLDLNPVRDVHGLRRQNGLHLCSALLSLSPLLLCNSPGCEIGDALKPQPPPFISS